jgi:uncharacterized membrane-anchored protein YitT (DUF2179 family)
MKQGETVYFYVVSMACALFFGLWQKNTHAGIFMFAILGMIINLIYTILENYHGRRQS